MVNSISFVACPSAVVQAVQGLRPFQAEEHLPSRQPKPNGYRRVCLHRDPSLEVAAAHWSVGGESALHGHGCSAALYTILSGTVEEERFLPEGESYRHETVILRAGEKSYLPPGSFHRLRALTESVTLHSYSPAPYDPATPVPPAVLRLLERASVQPAARPVSPAPDLLELVDRLVEGWAERETRANQEGQLWMPALTVEEMRSSGILAAPLPRELGGWDTTLAETAEAVRRIARRAPSTALALVMPLGNAATTRIPESVIPVSARPALYDGKAWIAEQVRRGRILAVANSEPGAGGDLSSTRTQAEQGPDGVYRLTGRKSFATFGRDADWFLCAARRRDEALGRDVVDGFFVARDEVGVTLDDRWNPVGMRPTASIGLTLEKAPAGALLGFPGCLEGVNARHWSTVLFAAVFLGVGEGALREGLNSSASDSTWVRSTLAEQALTLEAGAGFVEAVARDERWPLPREAQEKTRRAKTFVARAAVETATKVAMASGGRAYTPQHPVFRFLCDALAGPLLRPPLPRAMDEVVKSLFSGREEGKKAG